jgi:hypothetical protein
MYEGIKEKCKDYSLERKTKLDEIHQEELKERKEILMEGLTKDLGITTEEDKNTLKTFFKKIIKHLEDGVSAEVKTPLLEAPRETVPEDDEQTKKSLIEDRKKFQAKEKIDQRNKEIYLLQKDSFNGVRANLGEAGDIA